MTTLARARLSAITVVVCLGSAAAGDLSYLGPGRSPGSASVRAADGRVRELRVGEALADVGELQRVEDDEIIFERPLGDEEREALRERGLTVPDVQRLHVPRQPGTAETSDLEPGAVW
jgi:hypothetical protein